MVLYRLYLSDFTNTTVPIYFYFIGYNVRDFKDFGNFENFWGMMSKQEKKDFCDIRKNGIAMKILD